MTTKVDVKELLAAGAHFGHKTSRWHPKMSPYIHSKRGEIHIIDLIQTQQQLEEAMKFANKVGSEGKQILLVGTKRQAHDVVESTAKEHKLAFVSVRWLGGMLTNHKTMKGRIKRLKDLEEKMNSGELQQRYSKLEVQKLQDEIDNLNRIFGGVKDMQGLPAVILVTDVITDENAVREANTLGIPVIGIVDSNSDPSNVDYPIPANDDAIKSISLITDYIVSAFLEGKANAKAKPAPKAKKPAKKPAAKTATKDTDKKADEKKPAKKPAAKSTKSKTAAKKVEKKPAKKAEKKGDK